MKKPVKEMLNMNVILFALIFVLSFLIGSYLGKDKAIAAPQCTTLGSGGSIASWYAGPFIDDPSTHSTSINSHCRKHRFFKGYLPELVDPLVVANNPRLMKCNIDEYVRGFGYNKGSSMDRDDIWVYCCKLAAP